MHPIRRSPASKASLRLLAGRDLSSLAATMLEPSDDELARFNLNGSDINWELWDSLAEASLNLLATDPNRERRIRGYYLPLVFWVLRVLEGRDSCLLLGLNGPQGSGKTTLTSYLCPMLQRARRRVAAVSIDDFYLTRSGQVELSKRFPGNRYLVQRGYPGTHDLELGTKSLRALKSLKAGEAFRAPQYDKSLHQGKGDRVPNENWQAIEGPLHVAFLEGWMLGYTAAHDVMLPVGDESFRTINQLLFGYEAWTSELGGFIQLVPEKVEYVIDWRIEAEERMKKQGKQGMSKDEIEKYVRLFLPAYEVYLAELVKSPPVSDNHLVIRIAKDRLPAN